MTSSRCVGDRMPDLLEVHQVAAAIRVEPRLLERGEHADRARRWVSGAAASGSAASSSSQQRARSTSDRRKPGVLELVLQRLAVGFEAVVRLGVEVVLEQVDEDVENAFLHYTFPGSRRLKRPPGCCCTRPSSSRMSSIEATAPACRPVRDHERVEAGRLEAERI